MRHQEKIKDRSREWARTHVEENRHRANQWAKNNPTRINERNKNWKKRHKHQVYFAKKLYLYGLTEAEFNLMLRLQDDKCAVCGESFGLRGPQIDHDHLTKAVRGLVCIKCNAMLGMAHDDINMLLKGVDYLRGYYFRGKVGE